jgi:DNA-binding response OmpR family regulator
MSGTMSDSLRVLVVEDDQDLAALLCDLLASEGYVPEAVHTGTAAVERARRSRPDALVLDVMLPETNGFEVCKQLKFSRETNLIPIVMLTCLDTPEHRHYGLKVGANRYLTKPFDGTALLRELRAAVARSRELAAGHTRTALEIQMQSDSKYLEQLHDMLSELFVATTLSEVEINRIRYAVLEMVENAIEWGNRGEKDLMVRVSYELTDEAVRFTITDQGPGFDPRDLAHAAKPDGDPLDHLLVREKLGLRDGGFGILIARGMVDSLEYNDRGNQVTLVKKLPKTAPSATASDSDSGAAVIPPGAPLINPGQAAASVSAPAPAPTEKPKPASVG